MYLFVLRDREQHQEGSEGKKGFAYMYANEKWFIQAESISLVCSFVLVLSQ